MNRLFHPLALLCGLLTLAGPAAAAQSKGKKYALVIGISEYKHASFPALKYTENDADGLAVELRKRTAGFESVRVLSTGQGKKNEKDSPTAENLRKAIEELLADKGKEDTVLIALAGHGIQLSVSDPDGKGKPKTFSYFCPSNADLTGISYTTGRSKSLLLIDDVFAGLTKSGAGTKLVLMDACRNDIEVKAATRNIDPGEITVPRGVGALFSCGPGQRAWETPKLGKGQGVFFHFVLEAIRGEAADRDGDVTWDGMTTYVRKNVSPWVAKNIGDGAKQSPHELTNVLGEPPVLVRVAKSKSIDKKDKPPIDSTKTPLVDLVKLYKKGLAHAEGRGEKFSPTEAVRCFRQAADGGHELSKAALSFYLARGLGMKTKDEDEAQKLAKQTYAFVKFQAEKEKADGDTQAIFARLHLMGLGTPRDESQALVWFRKGADNGSSLAMLHCGLLLATGRPGRPAKEPEAFGWYTRSAGKGNAEAMFWVGEFHAEGKGGLKKNVPMAITWFKKSAGREYGPAKERLKKLDR